MSAGTWGWPVCFYGARCAIAGAQALVLAGVSLLIGTCAAFAPWFARAVEQTVTTETLHSQRESAAWQLEATPPAILGCGPVTKAPEDLDQLIPADLRPLFSPPLLRP